jgi:hypothetical protein
MFRMQRWPHISASLRQRGLHKDLIPVSKIVNISVNMIAYHSGHYRDAKKRHPGMLWSNTVRDRGRYDGDNGTIDWR